MNHIVHKIAVTQDTDQITANYDYFMLMLKRSAEWWDLREEGLLVILSSQ